MNTAEQIADAALTLFYRQGFHATGVDQLSEAAGVTKRTLYRHFPGKDHLIEAALVRRDEQFMARMRAFIEARAPADRPQAYIDFVLAWGHEPGFHGCAFINAAAEFSAPQDQPHLQASQHKQRVLAYLVQLCQDADAMSAEQLAHQLFLLGEGLIVTMQVMGTPSPAMANAARQTVTTWLAGATPTP